METEIIQAPEFGRTQTTDPREAKLKDTIEKRKKDALQGQALGIWISTGFTT